MQIRSLNCLSFFDRPDNAWRKSACWLRGSLWFRGVQFQKLSVSRLSSSFEESKPESFLHKDNPKFIIGAMLQQTVSGWSTGNNSTLLTINIRSIIIYPRSPKIPTKSLEFSEQSTLTLQWYLFLYSLMCLFWIYNYKYHNKIMVNVVLFRKEENHLLNCRTMDPRTPGSNWQVSNLLFRRKNRNGWGSLFIIHHQNPRIAWRQPSAVLPYDYRHELPQVRTYQIRRLWKFVQVSRKVRHFAI